MKKLTAVLMTLVLLFSAVVSVAATGDPEFSYQLILTDQNGQTVKDPRKLSRGDTLNVEIVLTRKNVNTDYDMFGIEFRLLTRGLQFNNDGATLRNDTEVLEQIYSDGSYVGFAWYDMTQEGENTSSPIMAGQWSYTVTEPSRVNLKVPVALTYVSGYTMEFVPVSVGKVVLDFAGNGVLVENGEIVKGELIGDDVSGEYETGTVIILPDMEMGDMVFVGWSDGVNIYPAGSEYIVNGIVTLVPVFKELERSRYIEFDPAGGEIVGEDPTGFYADGEIIIMPQAQREGYVFLGWNDAVMMHQTGETHVVDNSLTLRAQWEDPSKPIDPTTPGTPGTPGVPGTPSMPGAIGETMGGSGAGILLALLGLFALLLILWKRRFVYYSLVNGDISLSVKDKERDVQVEVILINNDDKEHHLGKSGVVPAGECLRMIKNTAQLPVAAVEKGEYKGKLIIGDGVHLEEKKCRIKAVDRELEDQSKG